MGSLDVMMRSESFIIIITTVLLSIHYLKVGYVKKTNNSVTITVNNVLIILFKKITRSKGF